MCSAHATSQEHVPPKCLFPSQKDLPGGVDLRKELITVPSCEVHNSAKSKDDEYLLYALSLSIANNQTGTDHFGTKVLRAAIRRPATINAITSNALAVAVEDTETGQVDQTLALEVNYQRISTGFEMMGRALYFHHFQRAWTGSVQVVASFLIALTDSDAREINEQRERITANVEEFVSRGTIYGENPQVFSYQFAQASGAIDTVMLMRFYGNSKVVLLFRDV
jgi:hypothetical protein